MVKESSIYNTVFGSFAVSNFWKVEMFSYTTIPLFIVSLREAAIKKDLQGLLHGCNGRILS